METKKISFINNGYCLIKKNFFNIIEINKIEEILNKLIESQNPDIEIDRNVVGGKSLVMQNFIDENLELKNYINKIFASKEILSVIKNNIGENFKIKEITYRKSYSGDEGLHLHQDADGENGLTLNLGGVESHYGKTCFIKSSHHFSTINKLINRGSISHRFIKIFKFFLDFIDCSAGSIVMFDNKVWHGRFPNKSNATSSALMFALYKGGSTITFQHKKNFFKKNMSKLDLKKYELDRLRCLNDNLVESVGSDNYFIIPDNNKKNNNFFNKKKNFKTMFFIFLIRFIYFFKRA
jgi:putative 2OG-Fe(II) oxygenase